MNKTKFIDLEKYALDHSDHPSSICQSIFEYTTQNVSMPQMLIGPNVMGFIQFFLRLNGAKRVLEVGTFTGYSALAMAEVLPEKGEVITLDINSETASIANEFWQKSPHGKKIKSIVSPALSTMNTLEGKFDFILIDADKPGYANYVQWALEHLSDRGWIACDNMFMSGDVLERDEALKEQDKAGAFALKKLASEIGQRKDLKKFLLPLRDGLLLIQKG